MPSELAAGVVGESDSSPAGEVSGQITHGLRSLLGRESLTITLLLVFFLHGLIYASVFPLWSTPDEPGHYEAAEMHALRVNAGYDKDIFVETTYRGHRRGTGPSHSFWGRPTGYYWLAGLVLQPFSFAGFGVRAYVLRLLSILLNTGAIYFTYRLARDIFPKEKLIYYSAPLMMAMLPMFTFTGMSINSDNLAILLFTVFLWSVVRIIVSGFHPSLLLFAVISVAAGILTKRTTFVSAFFLTLVPFFYIFREPAQNRRQVLMRALPFAVAGLAVTLTFPFLVRLGRAFAEMDALEIIKNIFALPERASEIDSAVHFLATTFWGNFGWLDLMRPQGYVDLQRVWRLPLIGFALTGVAALLFGRKILTRVQILSLMFLAVVVGTVTFIVAIWPLISGVWGSGIQSRYGWPVLGAGAILFCAGTIRAAPYPLFILHFFGFLRMLGLGGHVNRLGRWLTVCVFLLLVGGMFALDMSLLFSLIIPRYYAQFGFAGIEIREPAALVNGFMSHYFLEFGIVGDEVVQVLDWRPALFNSRAYFGVLFLSYFATLAFLVVGIVRDQLFGDQAD